MNSAAVNPVAPTVQPMAAKVEVGGIGGKALRGLLQMLFKRLYLALGVLALVIALGIAHLFITQPQFRAVTLLEIFRDNADQSSNPVNEPRPVQVVDNEFYETQFGLLRSEAIATAVVRKLKLRDNPAFLAPLPDGVRMTRQLAYEREVQAVQKLQANLQVVPARQSRLVEVRYIDADPQLAAKIADAVANTFIESNFERRVQRSDFARAFLAKQIDDLRQKFEIQERELVEYAASKQILNVPASRSSERNDGAAQTAGQSIAGAELAALNDELAKARADRAAAAGRLAAAGNRGDGSSPDSLTNNAINGLQQQRALVAASVANMAELFDDNYPPLIAKRSELATLDSQIRGLNQQIRTSVRSDFEAAESRERSLQAKVDELKGQLIDVTRASVDYNILQREVDTTRQQYENLLQRLKELSIANDIGASNVSIVQAARVPLKPFAPDVIQTLLLALLIGIVLAVAAVIVAELLDTKVNSPETIHERFAEPLVGIIPAIPDADIYSALADPKSPLSEAYVATLANLRFATPQGAPHVLSVTSTRPAEGKSTTAMALAMLCARQGERVVLIDADMRKPTVHKRLGLTNVAGFSNLLTGQDDITSVIQTSEIAANVSLISAGPTPPNPGELLSDRRLHELFDRFRDQFDRVIVDNPPVLGLADAPLLANAADGTLFVIEAGRSQVGESRRAIDRLLAMQATVVGVVLSKFSARATRFDDYNYASYQYYSYRNSSE